MSLQIPCLGGYIVALVASVSNISILFSCRFRNCLKLVRTQAADIVGNLFFNVINIPCFVFSKEPVCTARNWWGRCTLEEEKPVAIWKKPLPYWNRSV